jgi:hypothetical protein
VVTRRNQHHKQEVDEQREQIHHEHETFDLREMFQQKQDALEKRQSDTEAAADRLSA